MLLGARKIVFHSGMNPYAYYKQGWADQVSRFFSEFMDGRQELEIVLENVFDDDWELLLDVYKKVDHPNFKLPGHWTCTLLFVCGCAGVGESPCTLCDPCACT